MANFKIMGYSLEQMVLPLATAIGAYGGFPDPPRFFNNLVRNEFFRYVLLAVLIYQGGAGQDIKLSVLVTFVIFALTKALNQ